MHPQERQQLTHFLGQLSQASVPEKVPEADTLIRQALARQPDAAYLLVQRTLLLEQALNAAKAQIANLQKQVDDLRTAPRSGFLGGNPWGQEPAQIPGAVPGAGNYSIPRTAPTANFGAGAPSFLGNVASTAAGVVAGSFLFQGIESLMGHHDSGFGQGSLAGSEHPVEETVINNYYGSDADASWNSTGAGDPFSDVDDFAQDSGDDSSWI